MGRWGGLIIVVLISGSRSRGSRPRTLCGVLEQDTLLSISPCLNPYPGVLMHTAEFHAGGTMYIVNTAMD